MRPGLATRGKDGEARRDLAERSFYAACPHCTLEPTHVQCESCEKLNVLLPEHRGPGRVALPEHLWPENVERREQEAAVLAEKLKLDEEQRKREEEKAQIAANSEMIVARGGGGRVVIEDGTKTVKAKTKNVKARIGLEHAEAELRLLRNPPPPPEERTAVEEVLRAIGVPFEGGRSPQSLQRVKEQAQQEIQAFENISEGRRREWLAALDRYIDQRLSEDAI